MPSTPSWIIILLIGCLAVSGVALFKLEQITLSQQDMRVEVAKLQAKLESLQTVQAAQTSIPVSTTPQIAVTAQSPTQATVQTAMEEVFTPDAISPEQKSRIDVIKRNTESILVNHYFLEKCGKVTEQDIHVIMSGLVDEMASVNAPGRLKHDILTAARGSYEEMYATVECSPENIDGLMPGYNNYLNAIESNYAPEAPATDTGAATQ